MLLDMQMDQKWFLLDWLVSPWHIIIIIIIIIIMIIIIMIKMIKMIIIIIGWSHRGR